MKLLPVDFLGSWRIRRSITDHLSNAVGTLEGEATFHGDDGALHYYEQGTLNFGRAAPMVAERRYIWTFYDDTVSVAHADGAPFHSFAWSALPTATPHLCGEDLYEGAYHFAAFPAWRVTWTVQGPCKDYQSITAYQRA